MTGSKETLIDMYEAELHNEPERTQIEIETLKSLKDGHNKANSTDTSKRN